MIFAALAFAASAIASAQSALPPQTLPGSTLTPNPSSVCVAGNTCSASLWRCTGAASACSPTAAVWNQIGAALTGLVGTGTQPNFPADTTGTIGTAYTYVIVYTQGSITAYSTNTYTGTPVALPLATGGISGITS